MKKLTIIIIGLMLVTDCIAATHYVVMPGTAGANPTDPYTSWATAGTNIIDVVNAALTKTAPRVVWVTNGTYYPTNVIIIAAAPSFTLQSVNGRDVTILNGSQTTKQCTDFSYNSPYGVFDGFTVTNYSHSSASRGTVYGASIRVINCLFTGNSNLTSYGAGAFMDGWGAGTITNCIFRNNYSGSYGAVLIGYYVGTSNLVSRITDCRFEGNRSGSYGGAVAFATPCNIISNCVFINNTAQSYGGALYIMSASTNSLVVNCTFTGNAAAYSGGGILNYGKATIRNCSLIENIIGYNGGGIYGTNMTIRNCLIARNQSSQYTGLGGGMWIGENCIVESCTIVSNYAKYGGGGGLYVSGSGSRGTNNIIYYNTAPNGANFTNTAGNTGLNYSCVIPAVGGTGNTTNDPALNNLDGGNYRLTANSPCVNTGKNQDWMSGAMDLEGHRRVDRFSGIVDMGCYEYLPSGTMFIIR